MPRCPHCGEAVKPERGPLVDLDDLAKRDAAQYMYKALEKVESIRRSILNDEMSDLDSGHLKACLAKHARELLNLGSLIGSALAKARGEE